MLKRILLNKKLSFKERLKNIIVYYRKRRGAVIQWNKRYKKVFKLHPSFKWPIEGTDEQAHRLYWRNFSKRINLSTFRVCTNISGISNPKYIPEEIFRVDIEPTINNSPAVEYLTYKSFYNHWFPGNIFPSDFFHNVDGEWLDEALNSISFSKVKSIAQNLKYPVVLKPNRDSYGGKNIYFPVNCDELMNLCKGRKNFLVQERIKQNSFFEQFNPHGLNTLRVNVYRSVKDNQMHIVNVALRMGVGGSLDNLTSGGIATMVRENGFLNGFALDKFGEKHLKHPDTGMEFNGQIPDYNGLKEISVKIAHKVFYARLIALDFCFDANENWRMIEINIYGATIRFAQYHGSLFFDKFTDEVYDFCSMSHWTLK